MRFSEQARTRSQYFRLTEDGWKTRSATVEWAKIVLPPPEIYLGYVRLKLESQYCRKPWLGQGWLDGTPSISPNPVILHLAKPTLHGLQKPAFVETPRALPQLSRMEKATLRLDSFFGDPRTGEMTTFCMRKSVKHMARGFFFFSHLYVNHPVRSPLHPVVVFTSVLEWSQAEVFVTSGQLWLPSQQPYRSQLEILYRLHRNCGQVVVSGRSL